MVDTCTSNGNWSPTKVVEVGACGGRVSVAHGATTETTISLASGRRVAGVLITDNADGLVYADGELLESPDGRLPGVSTYVFTDAVGTSYCYDRVLADLPADPGTYGAAGVEGPVGGPTGNTLNTPNNELFYIPIGLGVHTGPTGRSPEPTSAKPGRPDPTAGSPLDTGDGRAINADKGDGLCGCSNAAPNIPSQTVVVNDASTALATDYFRYEDFPTGVCFCGGYEMEQPPVPALPKKPLLRDNYRVRLGNAPGGKVWANNGEKGIPNLTSREIVAVEEATQGAWELAKAAWDRLSKYVIYEGENPFGKLAGMDETEEAEIQALIDAYFGPGHTIDEIEEKLRTYVTYLNMGTQREENAILATNMGLPGLMDPEVNYEVLISTCISEQGLENAGMAHHREMANAAGSSNRRRSLGRIEVSVYLLRPRPSGTKTKLANDIRLVILHEWHHAIMNSGDHVYLNDPLDNPKDPKNWRDGVDAPAGKHIDNADSWAGFIGRLAGMSKTDNQNK